MTSTDKELIARLREEVEETKIKEVELNRHLKYKDDHHKGSLAITLRWSYLERILDLAEKGLKKEVNK